MKKILENFKGGIIFGAGILFILLLGGNIYALVNSVWTLPEDLQATSGSVLSANSWNRILSNQNALSGSLLTLGGKINSLSGELNDRILSIENDISHIEFPLTFPEIDTYTDYTNIITNGEILTIPDNGYITMANTYSGTSLSSLEILDTNNNVIISSVAGCDCTKPQSAWLPVRKGQRVKCTWVGNLTYLHFIPLK